MNFKKIGMIIKPYNIIPSRIIRIQIFRTSINIYTSVEQPRS